MTLTNTAQEKKSVNSFIKTKPAIVFYLLNFFITIQILRVSLSFMNFLFFVGINIILFIIVDYIYLNREQVLPGSLFLPVFFFADILLFFIITFESLSYGSSLISYFEPQFVLVFFVCNLAAFGLLFLKQKKACLLSYVLVAFSGIISISWVYVGAINPPYLGTDEYFLCLTYFSFLGVWFYFSSISIMIFPEKRNIIRGMGGILYVLIIGMILFDSTYFLEITNIIYQQNIEGDFILFSWPTVIISCVITLLCAYLVWNKKNNSIDSFVLLSIAEGILLSKILMGTYFPYRWIFTLIFLFICLYLLSNEISAEKTLHLNNMVFVSFISCLICFVCFLTSSGYLFNAVIFVLFFIVMYTFKYCDFNIDNQIKKQIIWQFVLFVIYFNFVIFYFVSRLHIDLILSITFCYISSSLLLFILGRRYYSLPNTGDREVHFPVTRKLKIIVCSLLLIVCFIPFTQHGVSIKAERSISQVAISAQANGEDNKIATVMYYWGDGFMQDQSRVQTINVNKDTFSQDFTIDTWQLNIIMIDNDGVYTEKRFYFPVWLYSN